MSIESSLFSVTGVRYVSWNEDRRLCRLRERGTNRPVNIREKFAKTCKVAEILRGISVFPLRPYSIERVDLTNVVIFEFYEKFHR